MCGARPARRASPARQPRSPAARLQALAGRPRGGAGGHGRLARRERSRGSRHRLSARAARSSRAARSASPTRGGRAGAGARARACTRSPKHEPPPTEVRTGSWRATCSRRATHPDEDGRGLPFVRTLAAIGGRAGRSRSAACKPEHVRRCARRVCTGVAVIRGIWDARMPNRPPATIFQRMTTPLVHEPSTIALTVNGDSRTIAAGTSLSAYLASSEARSAPRRGRAQPGDPARSRRVSVDRARRGRRRSRSCISSEAADVTAAARSVHHARHAVRHRGARVSLAPDGRHGQVRVERADDRGASRRRAPRS